MGGLDVISIIFKMPKSNIICLKKLDLNCYVTVTLWLNFIKSWTVVPHDENMFNEKVNRVNSNKLEMSK